MRIVVDPDELNRFAALAVEAADDHAASSERLARLELPAMPPEVTLLVSDALGRVASDLRDLSTVLYAEALVLRARAAALDPALRRYLMRGLTSLPG